MAINQPDQPAVTDQWTLSEIRQVVVALEGDGFWERYGEDIAVVLLDVIDAYEAEAARGHKPA